MFKNWKRNQKGISLVDAMLAIAIFAIASVAMAYMLVGALRTTSRTSFEQRALSYTHEGVDAVLSIRDWQFLDITDGTHGLTNTNGYWELTGAPDSLDGGTYTRTIEITSLNRDSATYDLSDVGTISGRTKQISIVVSWAEGSTTRQVSATQYITDWSIREWTEKSDTDFAGGTFSDVDVIDTGDGAHLELGTTTGGGGDGWNKWILGGGTHVVHDTDIDFSSGTFSSTAISGTGTAAKIQLATSDRWTEFNSTANDVSEIYGITVDESTGEGWGVGYLGGIIHRQNGLWFNADSPTANTLWAIDSLSSNDAWAVGNSGTILRFNGNKWFSVTSPTTTGLFGVSLLSETDGWAVGAGGTVLRYNGANWQTFGSSLTTQSLNAVAVYSDTLAFAVGNNGVAYEFNGTSWSSSSTGTSRDLYGVAIVSPTEAWAVGENGTIRKWNGTSWSNFSSPTGLDLRDIQFVSASEAWAVAGESLDDTEIIYYDGVSWTTVNNPTNRPLYTVDIDGTLAVIGGGTTSGADDGVVLELSGSTWEAVFAPSDSEDMNDINFYSTTFGVSVGDSGVVRHYNGDDWITVSFPDTTNLYGVYIISPTNAWASGSSGKFFHWDGTSWNQTVDLGSQTWRGIYCTSTTNCWAAGDSGRIARWNGTSWSQYTDLGGQTWYGVDCTSTSDCWMSGNSGRIARWNGTSWSQYVDLGSQTWYDIKMFSATEGWIVGKNGSMYVWNGTSWTAEASLTGDDINSIDGTSVTNIWTTGENGTILNRSTFYDSSGTYLSPVIDASASTTWNLVSWIEDISSANSNVTIATRTGNTASPDGGWTGFSSELTTELGSSITSSNGRYLQYRITLSTNNIRTTPSLDRIDISYGNPTTQDLRGVSLDSSGSGWAVGTNGTATSFDGTKWTIATTPNTSTWHAVNSLSGSDAWSVGSLGIVERWNGASWANAASPTASTMNGLDMYDSSFGIAAGSGGSIISYNGTSWTTSASPTAATLYGVSLVSASDGWIVGSSGVSLHLSGGSWLSVASGTGSTLYGVDSVATNDVWAVGASGTIIHWDGASWSSVYSPVTTTLRSVSFTSATDGWAVGDSGVILHYNGYGWEQTESLTSQILYYIDMIDESDGWIVGGNGTFIRWHGSGGGSVPATSGSYESAIFDSELTPAVWETVSWIETVPVGTTLTVELRSGDTAVPDGSWSAYVPLTTSSGEAITVPDSRYLQYRVSLDTTVSPTTPSLDEITITYE